MMPLAIVGGWTAVMAGSKRMACEGCRVWVWLAPSGQRKAKAGARVLCMDCADADVQRGITHYIAPSREDLLSDLMGGSDN
jgi:hypothetical protein